MRTVQLTILKTVTFALLFLHFHYIELLKVNYLLTLGDYFGRDLKVCMILCGLGTIVLI